MVEGRGAGPPEEPAPFLVTFSELSDAARNRRRGPLRRGALFASGVNLRLLKHVPTDETVYSVLGTSVMLTAIVAAAASGVAAGYLTTGQAQLNPVTVSCGIAFGLFIFMLDRTLVKAPLNPYRFEPAIF